MADEVTAGVGTDKRAVFLKAANGGNVLVKEMLEAIGELEKQRQTGEGVQALNGEWLLVWTSGTKRYQEFNKDVLDARIKPISSNNKVVQRINAASKWIENEVYFPFRSLLVAGRFEYTENKRIQFTFQRLRLKIGPLPAIQLPLGKWASGWLLSTYLDGEVQIERGDRGGVSVYGRFSVQGNHVQPFCLNHSN